jgi:hypothetical protein
LIASAVVIREAFHLGQAKWHQQGDLSFRECLVPEPHLGHVAFQHLKGIKVLATARVDVDIMVIEICSKNEGAVGGINAFRQRAFLIVSRAVRFGGCRCSDEIQRTLILRPIVDKSDMPPLVIALAWAKLCL